MENTQRPIVAITTFGKIYYGKIDVPNESMRTTDLLNSNTIYWKDPNEKCFDNSILLRDAKLALDEKAIYKKFNKVQLKYSEIIIFFDNYETIGDEQEKSRAVSMRDKTHETMKSVTIITPLIANSFFDINGKFYGLFKKKSKDKFIPLFEASVTEIKKIENKWSKKRINLPHTFLGINTQFIEAMSFED